MDSENGLETGRGNGGRGGPKTPEGKAVSRMNALKHGIFVTALSDRDHEELHGVCEKLCESFRPEGMVEEMLVEKLALVYLRLQRCARAEAQYQERIWEEVATPPQPEPPRRRRKKGEAEAPEPPAPPPPPRQYKFDHYAFERAAQLFWRYDTTFTNQMLRIIKELRSLQKERLAADGLGRRFTQIHDDEDKEGDERTERGQGSGDSDGKDLNPCHPCNQWSGVAVPPLQNEPTHGSDQLSAVGSQLPKMRLQNEPDSQEVLPAQVVATTTRAPEPAWLKENLWDCKRPPRRHVSEEDMPRRRWR